MDRYVPERVTTVMELGFEHGDYRYPMLSQSGDLILEDGERLLVVYHGEPRWDGGTLSEKTPIVVTDRRVAWIDTKYDKGGGWAGFGALGLAVSTTANAVSKARAKKRSAGTAAAGQVRYESLLSVDLMKKKALIGGTDSYLDLDFVTAEGTRTVRFWIRGKGVADAAAEYVAQVAAHRVRLLGADLLADEERARLATVVEGIPTVTDKTGAKRWTMATDFDAFKEILVRSGANYGGTS